MKRVLITLSVLAASSAAVQAAPEPVSATVTIGMLGDVVSNVGGTCVDVTTLMRPGVDPHLYQATASDVRSFVDADVIFYSGYSLEGQLGDVLEKFGQQKPTVAVGPAAVPPTELIATQDVYGIDPHLWMDVSLWALTAPVIADTLAEIQPDCAARFAQNASAYAAQLTALHDWAVEAVGTIPEGQRALVTAHDAFAYYGRAYGIEVAGIQGISTEAEASVADIRASVDLVVEKGVPAVFIESTINPRTIQAVIDAARQGGHEVAIGGELFSDAMGEAGTAGGTYIGMIYENTRHIVEALGGTPPALPEALGGWAETWGVAGG